MQNAARVSCVGIDLLCRDRGEALTVLALCCMYDGVQMIHTLEKTVLLEYVIMRMLSADMWNVRRV